MPAIVEAPIAPQMSAEILEGAVQAAVSAQTVSQAVTPAPIDENWQQALNISAMQERYPLLRNAL